VQRQDRPSAELDSVGTGREQHTDRFAVASRQRLTQTNPGQRLAGRPHGVDVIALRPSPAGGPLRPIDLDHRFIATQ
jgi:hypothetical protein